MLRKDFLVAFAASTLLLIFSTFRYGVALWGDTYAYFSGADSLFFHQTFADPNGVAITLWPPFYSCLICLFKIFTISDLCAAWILNGLSLFLTCAIYLSLFDRLEKKFKYVWLLAFLISAATIQGFSVALSDGVFAAETTLLTWFAVRYFEDHRIRNLLYMSLTAASLPMTRYIGGFAIPLGCVYVLLFDERKFLRSFIFGLISSLPIAIWFYRNFIISGHLTGPRNGSTRRFAEVLVDFAKSLGSWLLPGSNVFVMSAVVLLFLFAVYRFLRTDFSQRLAIIFFPTGYLIFLIGSSLKISYDALSNRFLLPIVPAFFFVLMILAAGLIKRPVVLFILLLHPMIQGFDRLHLNFSRGIGGYSTDEWQRSAFVTWLKSNEISKPIYTNSPEAVFFFADRPSTYLASGNCKIAGAGALFIYAALEGRKEACQPTDVTVNPISVEAGIYQFR